MNPEKLAKLQAHAAQVRIGGKGSARRKKKFVHRSAADDKKIQKEASKAEPDDVKPGPSQPKKEEPKIIELKLSDEFVEKCNVSTSTVPIEVKVEPTKIVEVSEDLSDEGKLSKEQWKNKKAHTIIAQEGVHFSKKSVKLGEDPGIFGTMPKGGIFERWNELVFYTFDEMKNLEAVLNSRTDYVKGHELRALCTVFFTRVDKELLVKIKSETENETLLKKAELDSGVTIDDLRHIGLGRTIRVHCRTPTGANTIVKNGLLIGGITLRKGKLEEFKLVTQCTHCWKMDHKIGHCPQYHAKEPAVCGTCGKSGHRRKECPTPSDPKCVICEGKHSSSAARCPVRQARINKRKLKSDRIGKSAENKASQRLKMMNELADMIIGDFKVEEVIKH